LAVEASLTALASCTRLWTRYRVCRRRNLKKLIVKLIGTKLLKPKKHRFSQTQLPRSKKYSTIHEKGTPFTSTPT